LCGINKLAFEYAERNSTDVRFNKGKKTSGKDWVIGFCKRQNLPIRLPDKYRLGRIIGIDDVQVTRFFDNLRAVFEKQPPPGKKISTRKKVACPVPQ